jgi:hypothetical protein
LIPGRSLTRLGWGTLTRVRCAGYGAVAGLATTGWVMMVDRAKASARPHGVLRLGWFEEKKGNGPGSVLDFSKKITNSNSNQN